MIKRYDALAVGFVCYEIVLSQRHSGVLISRKVSVTTGSDQDSSRQDQDTWASGAMQTWRVSNAVMNADCVEQKEGSLKGGKLLANCSSMRDTAGRCGCSRFGCSWMISGTALF